MTVGEKFKALRLALGLDQMAMAEQLYCSAAYLSQVEKGWCKPQHYLLERLNELYAIDPDEFGDESNRSYLPPGGIPARLRYTSPTRGNPKKRRTPRAPEPPAPQTPRCGKLCRKCWFHSNTWDTCDFFEITGVLRGCPIGDDCVRFTPRAGRKRRI